MLSKAMKKLPVVSVYHCQNKTVSQPLLVVTQVGIDIPNVV
jgi:hypothetical protein